MRVTFLIPTSRSGEVSPAQSKASEKSRGWMSTSVPIERLHSLLVMELMALFGLPSYFVMCS
jgi:hypothetical protein